MKSIIAVTCTVLLVALTAQADVILRFNGITVGTQWGGGYAAGPGLNGANPTGCTFDGNGQCTRIGDELTIITQPNSAYSVDIISDPNTFDFGFTTDGGNNLDGISGGDKTHVRKVDGTTMELLGREVFFSIPSGPPCCGKVMGGLNEAACSGTRTMLYGSHYVHWHGARDSCSSTTYNLDFDVVPGGVTPSLLAATGGSPSIVLMHMGPSVGAAAGPAGADGAQGEQGKIGPAGTNGTNGVDGATGAQGDQGKQGDAGADAPCIDCNDLSPLLIDFTCKILDANPPTSQQAFDDCVDAIVDAMTAATNVCGDKSACLAQIKADIDALK